MRVSSYLVNKSINTLSRVCINYIVDTYGCSKSTATNKFTNTLTYKMLKNEKSGFYLLSPMDITKKLYQELKGDIQSWVYF